MAAVITRPGSSFDGQKFFQHVSRDLPAYARPLFIRLQVSAREPPRDGRWGKDSPSSSSSSSCRR